VSARRLFVAALIAGVVASSCSLAPGQSDQYELVAYFDDVGDLVERATVQLNDVEIGAVTNIDLVLDGGDLTAKVSMSVDPAKRIPADGLTALVRQTSLLGEQFVELVPTTSGGPYVGEEDFTIPVERTDRRVDVETFLADLSGLIGNGGLEDLNRFTHAQALILEDRGRRFGRTLDELEKFTSVLADRSVDVGAAIDSLTSASDTLAANRATLDEFVDSLDEANALLADQGDELGALFRGLSRFGTVNARFLAKHETGIRRQFKALRPVFAALAGADRELRIDITKLRLFLELFPRSFGGGPGGSGQGDYIQAEAVVCEVLQACHTKGEKGDVPGQGSR
jgi:phospholipid/cholesterol/gamma-HCH transport system substrate-binding protein